jgi:S1-C subfamily serine protease
VEYYRRSLAIDEKALGKDHPATVAVQRNLSLCIAADSGFVRGKGDGVVVTSIVPGSQAEKLGLEFGDWIAEYRGIRVRNAEHLVTLVNNPSRGAHLSLLVVHKRHRLRLRPAPGPLGVKLSD